MCKVLDQFYDLKSFPMWWEQIPEHFRSHCKFVSIADLEINESVRQLRDLYVQRFDAERVNKRIPEQNWKRADICRHIVPPNLPVLDIGSGLGEFVNLFAIGNPTTPIASVDLKDYDLWFDASGRIERIYKSIFYLSSNEARDVVTCFEVIEHLPPARLAEAVVILRSLAKQKLFVSVPFMEPLPLYKGHFTRFDTELLEKLFPDARFTIFGKGGRSANKVLAWIMCEIDIKQETALKGTRS